MLKYKDIQNKPGILRSFSGLTKAWFESFTVKFNKQAYEESLEEGDRQRTMPRQRKRGGGHQERM